jgi:hypothetical protein
MSDDELKKAASVIMDICVSAVYQERDRLLAEKAALAADVELLQDIITGLADRIAAQSDQLSRNAERSSGE